LEVGERKNFALGEGRAKTIIENNKKIANIVTFSF